MFSRRLAKHLASNYFFLDVNTDSRYIRLSDVTGLMTYTNSRFLDNNFFSALTGNTIFNILNEAEAFGEVGYLAADLLYTISNIFRRLSRGLRGTNKHLSSPL